MIARRFRRKALRQLSRLLLRRLMRLEEPYFRPGAPSLSPIGEQYNQRADIGGREKFLNEYLFVHTHIPKTAGSALFQNLSSIFGGIHSHDLRLPRSTPIETLDAAQQATIHLISGHFSYERQHTLGRHPLYIAAVREPVSRAVSWYRYMSTRRGQRLPHQTVKGLDFDAAWRAVDQSPDFDERNLQARMLWGRDNGPARDWDRLKERIDEDYFLIIPQERLHDAIKMLREAFGVPKGPVTQANVSVAKPVEPSPEICREVLEANAMDVRVYDHVLATFDRRLDQACNFIAARCLQPAEAERARPAQPAPNTSPTPSSAPRSAQPDRVT